MSGPTPSPPPGPPPEHFPAPWASDWGEDPFGFWQAFTYQGVRQGFRWIPPTPQPFLMGSPAGEQGRDDDEVQHLVTLTRGYWLAETTCTQALWEAVMGNNPSGFKGERRPVETVSWEDAQGFIERLNTELDAFVGRVASRSGTAMAADHRSAQRTLQLRLPTEAEWEYACRAGTTGPFSFGDDITPGQAIYDSRETVDVASLPPNPWGLYEMQGNVWEWCRDWYGDYPPGSVTNPVGPDSGEGRVLRGGRWFYEAQYLRSAYRIHNVPGYRNQDIGFRLALGPELGPEGQAGTVRGRTVRTGSERSGPAGLGGGAGDARPVCGMMRFVPQAISE